MRVSDQETRVLARVIEMLGSGQPTVQHLDDYVVGYSTLGNIVAIQQGEVETLEAQRKLAWAEAFASAKEDKASDMLARAKADIAVDEIERAAIKARQKLTNFRNMRETVQEAIWGIKYLGRNGG